jgi:hypothetical protein
MMTINELAKLYNEIKKYTTHVESPDWFREAIGWPSDAGTWIEACIRFNNETPYFIFDDDAGSTLLISAENLEKIIKQYKGENMTDKSDIYNKLYELKEKIEELERIIV